MSPLLVIVNGHPGTGKTTLAHRLAKELRIGVFCKDEGKEILFDRVGWSDKEWSQKLSLASYGIMDYVVENTLSVGARIVIESNFIASYDSERIAAMIEKYHARAVQILLYCDEDVRSKRFHDRQTSGNRHAGHHLLDMAQKHLDGVRRAPLALDAPLIELDTTDFDTIDYEELIRRIQE